MEKVLSLLLLQMSIKQRLNFNAHRQELKATGLSQGSLLHF